MIDQSSILLEASTFLPDTFSDFALSVSVRAAAMLHAVLPLAVKDSTIWPSQNTMPLFLVVDEFALVLALVAIHEHAVAVHLVVNKVSSVTASIGPCVVPLSLHFVIAEHAFVA